MRRLLLTSRQSPGDIVMLTAAVRDLHLAAPGEYLTDVRTTAQDLWRHNPHLTPLDEKDRSIERIEMHYPLIHESNQRPYHFLHGYTQFLEKRLKCAIPVTRFQGDLHLSEEERREPFDGTLPDIPERYWILVAGGKYDFTAKWWNPKSFQKVVDHFRGRIQFVQCGEAGHWHPPLDGVVNLVGKTGVRDFMRLMYRADGVVCPVTFAMHLAAAVESPPNRPKKRPCVVIAGGREPPHWEAYPHHQFISTVGALDCCAEGGCWRSRCQRVNDGDAKDRNNLCECPVEVAEGLTIPRCMEMIRPEDVIRRIQQYYDGGVLPSPANGRASVIAKAQPINGRDIAPLQTPSVVHAKATSRESIRLAFPYGLDELIQFSIVLKHLRHYRPEVAIELEVPPKLGNIVRELCDEVLETTTPAFPAAVWSPCTTLQLRWPSTPAVEYLTERLKVSPILDLCRYSVTVEPTAVDTIRTLLEDSGLPPGSRGRAPIVVLDYGDPAGCHLCRAIESQKSRLQGMGLAISRLQGQELSLAAANGKISQHQLSPDELAAFISLSSMVIGPPGAATRLAATLQIPALVGSSSRHPVQTFDLAPSCRHVLDLECPPLAGSAARCFQEHYRALPLEQLEADFAETISKRLKVPRAQPPKPSPPAKPPSKSSPEPAVQTSTMVQFYHGLGDCAHFAHLIPLYRARGHEIVVDCTPDKRIIFEAAGARIAETTAPVVHAWGYPSGGTHEGHGHFWQGSKIGNNVSEPPLPNIGEKSALWDELGQSRIDIRPFLSPTAVSTAKSWLDRLPRPVVLFHQKGNTAQSRKSIADPVAAEFYREFIDQCEGTLVLLDWDQRVPRLASHRVRHLSDLGVCPLELLLTLMTEAELMIGVDSGPLHLTRFTNIPTIGVWQPGHYPSTYTMPRPEQLNLVLADQTRQWNRFKRIPWNVVEHPGTSFSGAGLADLTRRMLDRPRYLNVTTDRGGPLGTGPTQAQDLQLQQFIREFCQCRGRSELAEHWDRQRSFDVLFREAGRRFLNPQFVETGTIRAEEDFSGAGFFTYLAGAFLHRHGGRLDSVDLNPESVTFARTWTEVFGPTVQVHEGDSLEFLQRFERPTDVLYLDSLDTTSAGHAAHCLSELQLAYPRLHALSLVAIDDTPWKAGAWIGKGATAVPWLLERGWRVLYAGYQVVLSQNT